MSKKAEIFTFGPFQVNVARRLVERDGQPVPLTGKAFEILVVLIEGRGEIVDKESLLRQVWPDTVVEENNITVAMSSLRKALGETPANPKWIVTIPGRGYSFVGEVGYNPQPKAVLRSERPAAPAPAITSSAARSSIAPDPIPSNPVSPDAGRSVPAQAASADFVSTQPAPRRWRTTYLFYAFASAVIVVGMSIYGLVAWFAPGLLASSSRTSTPVHTIAILPFTVLNRDAKNEYLGLGLTDALITRLGNTQLIVRPLTTVTRFADHDPIQSGRDLSVDAVVEGSVQTADDSIRVSARLLRVRDGELLWAQSFDEPSGNAFALEDSIAGRVASNLAAPLTGQQQSAFNKRPTANAAAYADYLRGRYYAATFYTKEGYEKAHGYLQKAIQEDPGYALAYTGLADSYYDSSNMTYAPNEAMPRAKAAAQQAIALDSSLAAAHVSLAVVASKYDWNWDVTEKELQAALANDPNLATAHLYLGLYRAQFGDFDRAISELHRAQELDPLSGEINAYLGMVLYWARRYDDAILQLRQANTFDPSYFPNDVGLCWAFEAKGDTKAALDACTQAVERGARPWTTLALARAQALAGDRAGAVVTMASASKQSDLFVSGYDRAAVYAALGRNDEAFAALEEGFQSRAEWMVYLKVDPQMDSLRRDPRYAALIKRLAL